MGPFEFLYYLGYRLDKGWGKKRAKSLPRPVISVGNITLGGTGKTSLTTAIAMRAQDWGIMACVLTRGYKGKLAGPVLIKPGMKEEETGDEPLLMAQKGICVVKCPDRYKGGLYALDNLKPAPDLFILDDGYQHWRLKRDLDVLIISADDPWGGEKMLPFGRLREPVSQIKRADLIIVNKCAEVAPFLEKEIRNHNQKAPIYPASYKPAHVLDTERNEYPLSWFRNKELYAFSGIGEPLSFRKTLAGTGAIIKEFRAFRDHHRFTMQDLDEIKRAAKGAGAMWIITTEKDIMRLARRGDGYSGEGMYALSVELGVTDAFYGDIFKRLNLRRRPCDQTH